MLSYSKMHTTGDNDLNAVGDSTTLSGVVSTIQPDIRSRLLLHLLRCFCTSGSLWPLVTTVNDESVVCRTCAARCPPTHAPLVEFTATTCFGTCEFWAKRARQGKGYSFGDQGYRVRLCCVELMSCITKTTILVLATADSFDLTISALQSDVQSRKELPSGLL